MTITQSNPIFTEDERGLPMRTPHTRYKVECDICGRKIDLVSEEGVWNETLDAHGMTTWLRPEGRGHICKEHEAMAGGNLGIKPPPELEARVLELEDAVRSLTTLYDREYKAHGKTQLQVIELQKRILQTSSDQQRAEADRLRGYPGYD